MNDFDPCNPHFFRSNPSQEAVQDEYYKVYLTLHQDIINFAKYNISSTCHYEE